MSSFSLIQSWDQSHIATTADEKNEEISCKIFFDSIVFFNSLRANHPQEASLCSFNNQLSKDFGSAETTRLLESIQERLVRYVSRFYGLEVRREDLVLLHEFVCANFPGVIQTSLPPHDHRKSDVVVTYYANVKQDEGLVRLWNPRVEEGENLVLTPRSGDLVFVPGNVPHDVLPFQVSDPFVSVETHFSIKGFPKLPPPCARFA